MRGFISKSISLKMRIYHVCLLLILAFLAKADLDIEIEEEIDENDDGGDFKGGSYSGGSYTPKVSWDGEKLAQVGVIHLTNEIYDSEVSQSATPWLLVFSKD